MLDFLVALSLLTFYPVAIFIVRNPIGLLRNIFAVILASKSWIGFTSQTEYEASKLPELKPGVLNPLDASVISELEVQAKSKKVQLEYLLNRYCKKFYSQI